MASSSSTMLPSFEKLRGLENFSLWKFQMNKFLDVDDLWDVTDPSIEGNAIVSQDAGTKLKQRTATAKIFLMA